MPRPPYTVCFRRYSLLLGTFALALTFSATIAATADAQNLGSLTTALFAGIPGQNGTTDGPPGTATFSGPGDLTTDGTDLWVGGGTVIRRVTLSTGVVATVAGLAGQTGHVDDPAGENARFGSTSSVCAYGGTIWIGDGLNHRLRAMSAVAPFGVTTVAGSGVDGHVDGLGTAAVIGDIRGLVCHGGFVYFLEPGASTLRRFDPATGQVVTLAGSPGQTGVVEGVGAAARFISPRNMTVMGGVLYISDTQGGTIRSYDPASGYVDVVWGTVDPGYVDGVGAAVRVHRPRGITTDGTHLYWAESNKHTIRKGVLSTFEVGTVAGVPSLGGAPCPAFGCPGGYVEGTGPNAAFNGPWALVYVAPYFYVFDSGNFVIRRMRLTPTTRSDFNGDGSGDIAVYRPSTGQWFIRNQGGVQFGDPSDLPVPGDYNGDLVEDIAVFRPSTGQWFVRNQFTAQWGASGDIPVPADYDGDGQTDVAVFRPGTGTWYVRNQFTVQWGASGDIPMPADYNGDGAMEIAVYRPSTGAWYIRGMGTYHWGGLGDMPVPQDVNGDGRAELVVYRPDTGYWYSYNTATGATTADQFGTAGDIPALWRPGVRWLQRGDFDGDRRADPTVFRPSTGTWYFLQSSTGLATFTSTPWGASGDVPVPGDYRGLGRNQAAVFRPSTGMWYVQGGVSVALGVSSDLVVPGDYDGDGRTDVAVFRPSTGVWDLLSSSSGFTMVTSQTWGASGDVPVPGDYDGDRRTDLAVFRPSTGIWYVLLSSSGFTTFFQQSFGTTGDLPVVGDYDGDGRTDLAVFRPLNGTWYIRYSSTDFTTASSTVFGASGDTPVSADYDGDGRTDLAVYRGSTSTYYVQAQLSAVVGTSEDIPVLKQP